MKKSFFSFALAFFVTQVIYAVPLSSVQPKPVTGTQAAKDNAACKQDWITNSKGKDFIKFVVGGFVGIRSYNKDGYIKACTEGTLPPFSAMQ